MVLNLPLFFNDTHLVEMFSVYGVVVKAKVCVCVCARACRTSQLRFRFGPP